LISSKIRRKDDPYNTVVAGLVAGAVGAQKNRLLSSGLFSLYSGISNTMGNIAK
jgi:hypothetical protein